MIVEKCINMVCIEKGMDRTGRRLEMKECVRGGNEMLIVIGANYQSL